MFANQLHGDVAAAVERAARCFEQLGHTVEAAYPAALDVEDEDRQFIKVVSAWVAQGIDAVALRYGPPPQVWGLNFSRAIEHKREQVYWSPLQRVYNITRLSSAGELRDLALQRGVVDTALFAGHRAHVNERRLFTVARLDMAIDGVEAGVGDAVRKPTRRRPRRLSHR